MQAPTLLIHEPIPYLQDEVVLQDVRTQLGIQSACPLRDFVAPAHEAGLYGVQRELDALLRTVVQEQLYQVVTIRVYLLIQGYYRLKDSLH